jgi:outer membrane autotransporter protein
MIAELCNRGPSALLSKTVVTDSLRSFAKALSKTTFFGASVILFFGFIESAIAQQTVDGLLVPDGQILIGPVFRRNGSAVPSIRTGADANTYIFSVPPTRSFLNSDPAVVIHTSGPTQYVRVYTSGISKPVGGFIAPSDVVRGLTPSQIRDVLALPFLPDSTTIVKVPAGTFVLYGTAAPILGNFAANPPGIPSPGPWGHGGVIQGDLIGITSDQNARNAAFVPSGDYVNQQPIGAFALSYQPRGGGGNAGAVAEALDLATPPPQFSDMDTVYSSLDLLNIRSPGPLQSALIQLDGEGYADFASVEIAGAKTFMDTVRSQLRFERLDTGAAYEAGSDGKKISTVNTVPQSRVGAPDIWFAGFCGGGTVSGDNDSHGLNYAFGGPAIGIDIRVNTALLVGGAFSYERSGLSASGISGNGNLDTYVAGLYASYEHVQWYADATVGYAYSHGALERSVVFPGVSRTAQGSPNANEFLSTVETGYRLSVGEHTAVTPFATFQGIVIGQNAFGESGAGAIDLHIGSQTSASAGSVLGAELSHRLDIGSKWPLLMTLRAGWGHDFADTGRSINASFEGARGPAFTVNGVPAARDWAVVGTGLIIRVKGVDLFVHYDCLVAGDQWTQSGTAGIQFAF